MTRAPLHGCVEAAVAVWGPGDGTGRSQDKTAILCQARQRPLSPHHAMRGQYTYYLFSPSFKLKIRRREVAKHVSVRIGISKE